MCDKSDESFYVLTVGDVGDVGEIADLQKRILELEEENTKLKQQIKSLEYRMVNE